MMIADDNIRSLPTLLERVGCRIDNAWQRIQKGEAEWVSGSLELAQALAEGRERFAADQAFGAWLKENKHDHVNKDDRAALIGMADDPELAREVLTQTERRSYQHIWNEVKGRFLHVKKPDKLKRGRPAKGTIPAPKTDHAVETARRMKAEGRPVTRGTIRAEAGVSSNRAQTAVDLLAHEEEVLQEEREQQALKDTRDSLSPKSKIRLDDAIRIHKARLDKQFEQRVRDEVHRRIAAADDAMREQNKDLRLQVLALERIVGERGVFTKTQFRQMQMLCHPDNSASPNLRAELSQILVDSEKKLVKLDR